jgi:hypothetical protein
MRAVPGFELTPGLSAAERLLLALLAAAVAASLAAWIGSHVDAPAGPAGPAGGGSWTWVALVSIAGAAGASIGWALARQPPCLLRWQDGRWSWTDHAGTHDGAVQPKIDLGSWMLLVLRSREGGVRWAPIGRQRAGQAWHPLRATLFAPELASTRIDTGKGTGP